MDMLTNFNAIDNTPCNKPCDLYTHITTAIVRSYYQRIAFIMNTGFIKRCVYKCTRMILNLFNHTTKRDTVNMNIEYIHENADLLAGVIHIFTLGIVLYNNHLPVCRRDQKIPAFRQPTFRISEKPGNKQRYQQRKSPHFQVSKIKQHTRNEDGCNNVFDAWHGNGKHCLCRPFRIIHTLYLIVALNNHNLIFISNISIYCQGPVFLQHPVRTMEAIKFTNRACLFTRLLCWKNYLFCNNLLKWI